MPIYAMNICAKFHSNHSTTYRDIAAQKTGVDVWTDEQTKRQTS